MPFTTSEFFQVFAEYNRAIWPMQPLLIALAAAALISALALGDRLSKLASGLLALLWAWTGLAYHFAYFADVNPAARIFGALFLVQALLFVVAGPVRGSLSFRRLGGWDGAVGWTLIVYSLVVYPILNRVTGHAFMESPTFGAPCPVTIYTLGMLHFVRRPFPRHLLVIPILWAAIGGSAAFLLRVPQDLGLIAAGVAGVVLLVRTRRGAD